MKEKTTVTKKRQIIGTLIILLALIQILNFAIRNVNRRPVFYYSAEHFAERPLLNLIISDLNYPFKLINYYIYYLFGWAGLLSPFFLIVLGYTFFQKRTKRLKRIRVLLIWGLAETIVFIYLITYLSSLLAPEHVRSGELARLFSLYLQKIGGLSFTFLFFTWSLLSYIKFIKKQSWPEFFRSLARAGGKTIRLLAGLFAHLFAAKKGSARAAAQIRAERRKELPAKAAKAEAETTDKTVPTAEPVAAPKTDKQPAVTAAATATAAVTGAKNGETDKAVEAEYTVARISEFDSTRLKYTFPFAALKTNQTVTIVQEEVTGLKTRIKEVFQAFGITLNCTGLVAGPQLVRLEYDLPAGLQVKEIEKYKQDLSYRLGGLKVFMQAPIPGTTRFGIAVQRKECDVLGLGSYLTAMEERQEELPVFIGVTADGSPVWTDAAAFPHLLVAGATGSGKSVFLNSLIIGLVCASTRVPVNLILVDPKRVEFAPYQKLRLLASPVIVEPAALEEVLGECERIMEARYESLSRKGVRNIREYNELTGQARLPYLFIIIDEFADIIMQDKSKTIKESIIRLAQKARATGIHLVLATQRPSTDIIDGTIKANFPSRIAFKTASQVDSRIILDENGAENLLGKGDMLFKSLAGESTRLQGIYIGLEEIRQVIGSGEK